MQLEMSLWLFTVLLVLFFIAALESGFWLGLRKHRIEEDSEKTVRGDVSLGSMLALLGLLLAFTYAFSLSRADHRKDAIINEANAINTAFLRADFAAEPGRTELRQQLLEYARTRVVASEMVANAAVFRQTVERSLEAQDKLWPALEEVMQGDDPWPIKTSIMLSVNGVLDAHYKRMAAVHDRLPGTILALLVSVAMVSLAVVGYQAGLTGSMNHWRRSAFVLMLAVLILIIVDFDRSLEGTIQVNQQPMTSLVKVMESAIEKDSVPL